MVALLTVFLPGGATSPPVIAPTVKPKDKNSGPKRGGPQPFMCSGRGTSPRNLKSQSSPASEAEITHREPPRKGMSNFSGHLYVLDGFIWRNLRRFRQISPCSQKTVDEMAVDAVFIEPVSRLLSLQTGKSRWPGGAKARGTAKKPSVSDAYVTECIESTQNQTGNLLAQSGNK